MFSSSDRVIAMAASAALRELPPSPGLVAAIGSVRTASERERFQEALRERAILRNLLSHARQDRADLEQAQSWLKEHFDLPAPTDIEVEWYVQAVRDAIAKEREAEKAFKPVINALKSVSAQPEDNFDEEVQGLLRDGIDVMEGWLMHFHRLHEMLARQLAERRGANREVLPAKTVKGEVDWAELSREHIARYPKIRARLAE
jgi:hypothetical protein